MKLQLNHQIYLGNEIIQKNRKRTNKTPITGLFYKIYLNIFIDLFLSNAFIFFSIFLEEIELLQ